MQAIFTVFPYVFSFFKDIEELEDTTIKPIAYTVNSENGCVTLSETHFADLQRTIQSFKAQLEQKNYACRLAQQV